MKQWIKENFFVLLIGAVVVGFLISRYRVNSESGLLRDSDFFQASVDSGLNPELSPKWALPDLEGNIFQSESLKGKVAVLNFWATWCAPCLAELPGLVSLQETYGPKGLEVVGISLDQIDSASLQRFVDKHALNYKILRDDDFSVMSQFVSFQVVPVTFILDQEGRITEAYLGGVSKQILEQEVLDLLRD